MKIKLKMKSFIPSMGIILLLASSHLFAEESKNEIVLQNSTSLTIKCDLKLEKFRATFIKLNPKQVKSRPDFDITKEIRCYEDVNSLAKTEFIPFKFESYGKYEFLVDDVPCEKCLGGEKTFKTLVIKTPTKKRIYNKK